MFDSTGDPRVDLSVQLVRSQSEDVISRGIEAILALKSEEAEEDAFVMAFHTRNVRGGKGERDVSKHMFTSLHKEKPELFVDLLDLFPHFGSWKDLFQLANQENVSPILRQRVLSIAATQLRKDRDSQSQSVQVVAAAAAAVPGEEKDAQHQPGPAVPSLSLCAKWAPRQGKSLPCVLNQLAKLLFPTVVHLSSRLKDYRKLVAGLNRSLNTVEVKMCAGTFDTIDPKAVPGRAGKRYAKAFLNLPVNTVAGAGGMHAQQLRHPEDAERMACRARFQEHYAKAARGEAKVNGADTVFPHELVSSAMNDPRMDEDRRNHVRGVWKSIVEKAVKGGGLGRSLAMCDFSGSMEYPETNGASPYLVSLALGLLMSECTTEEFKDVILTFDSTPALHHFPADSDIFTRIDTIIDSRVGQGTSTDFQAAMDLVLKRLTERRVRPGQEPENLIVLTDMNWDEACPQNRISSSSGNSYQQVVKTDAWQTHVEMIRAAFKRAGEELWGEGQGWTMPTIVIWNLAATSSDFHATADTEGVGFLSGWSPALFSVLQDKGLKEAKKTKGHTTPYEMLRLELDNEQYSVVRERIRSFRKGAAAVAAATAAAATDASAAAAGGAGGAGGGAGAAAAVVVANTAGAAASAAVVVGQGEEKKE